MKEKNEIAKTNTNIVLSDEPSWWSTLSETQRDVIMWTGIGIGVLGVGVLGFHIIRKQVRESKAHITENKAFGDNKHATWAKQLQLAFENDMFWGMGTDEELVRKTMLAIPSIQDYEKVEKAYQKLTKGGSLAEDLASELSASEYSEMLAIKRQKVQKAKDAKGGPTYSPESWAIRLKAAFDYTWLGIPGTDEEAILAVFGEMPDHVAYFKTKKAYAKRYPGHNLSQDLDGDLDPYYSFDWRVLLKKKPKGY